MHSPVPLVGREAELARLHTWLAQARSGRRQVGFVTGEAGLGKTTLVEAFVAEIGGYEPLCIGRGQCMEHYGAGEAYLPVLEALGRLCRGRGGQELVALLGQQAPTWLVQMPGLVRAADLETLRRRSVGTTRERMLRELAEALAVVDATGGRLHEAELYRLQGELLLQQALPDAALRAAVCFQQARSWELRAAMSLSRL